MDSSLSGDELVVYGYENASGDDPALMVESLSTESEECAVSKQISAVNFKCVGVTRDPSYQEMGRKFKQKEKQNE